MLDRFARFEGCHSAHCAHNRTEICLIISLGFYPQGFETPAEAAKSLLFREFRCQDQAAMEILKLN